MALDQAAKDAVEFFKNNLCPKLWPKEDYSMGAIASDYSGKAFNNQTLQEALAQLQTQRLEPSKILVSRKMFDEILRDRNINPTPNAEFFVSAHNAGRAVDIVVDKNLKPGEIFVLGPQKQFGRISNV